MFSPELASPVGRGKKCGIFVLVRKSFSARNFSYRLMEAIIAAKKEHLS